MTVKLMGAVLLVACGGLIGLGMLREAGGRIRLLDKLERALALMEAEISLCCRPLPDVFEQLKWEKDGEIFSELAEKSYALSAWEAWSLWCEALELPQEAKKALGSLGAVLGRYDASRQSAEIRLARERLGMIRESLQTDKDTKQRNYPILGVCLAGIAAMLII